MAQSYFVALCLPGTDFLFGNGAAVFSNCTILAEPGQFWSFITAANGNCTDSACSTGTAPWLLENCRLPAQPGGRIGAFSDG